MTPQLRGDSALVLKQVQSLWECRAPNLVGLRDRAVLRMSALATARRVAWVAEQVPREANSDAHELAAAVLDAIDRGEASSADVDGCYES